MMRSTLAMAAACLVLAACGGGGGGGGLPELKPRPPGPSFDAAAGQRDAQRRALGLALDSANARTAGLDADSGDDEMEKAAAALTGLAARIAEAHSLPASEVATARANLATYRQRRDTAELARTRAAVDALDRDSTEAEFAAAAAAIDALETRIGQARYLSTARRTALETAIAALRTDHRGTVAAAEPETVLALASTLTGRLTAASTDAEFQAAQAAIDALETALAENAGELTDEQAASFRAALASLRTDWNSKRTPSPPTPISETPATLFSGLSGNLHTVNIEEQDLLSGTLTGTFDGNERELVENRNTPVAELGVWKGRDYVLEDAVTGERHTAVVYSNEFPVFRDQDYLLFGWWARATAAAIDVTPFYHAHGEADLADRNAGFFTEGANIALEAWPALPDPAPTGEDALPPLASLTQNRAGTGTNTLTYNGTAAGLVAVYREAGHTGNLAGSFTADVTLTASMNLMRSESRTATLVPADAHNPARYEIEATPGQIRIQDGSGIYGTVDNFVVDGTAQAGWKVHLSAMGAAAPIHGNFTFAGGTAQTQWDLSETDTGTACRAPCGSWGGGFYQAGPGHIPPREDAVLGVFTASHGEIGRMTGAFGATR